MLSREAANTSFIVFGSTRLRLEATIYRTWGKHANHYATDVVLTSIDDWRLLATHFVIINLQLMHTELFCFVFLAIVAGINCWFDSNCCKLNWLATHSQSSNINWYRQICVGFFFGYPVNTILFSCSQKLLKLFDFPVFWLWMYPMKVFTETCHAH